ncbi:MAG: hypothetical protein AAF561_02235 [Planctomycetota bacterium]
MPTDEDANNDRDDVFICPADELTILSDQTGGQIAWGFDHNTSYKGLLFFGWYNDSPNRNLSMQIQKLPHDEGKYNIRRGEPVPVLVEAVEIGDSQFGLTVPYKSNVFREEAIENSTPHPDGKRAVAYADGAVLNGRVVFKRNVLNQETFFHPQMQE